PLSPSITGVPRMTNICDELNSQRNPFVGRRARDQMRRATKAEVRLDEGKPAVASPARQAAHSSGGAWHQSRGCRLSLRSPALRIRGRTYCPRAPKALLSGKYRISLDEARMLQMTF